jgi:type I site-specific restriction endonuclease
VVGAKAAYKHPADGLRQARDYASIFGLPFAYATNGTGIPATESGSLRETPTPFKPKG